MKCIKLISAAITCFTLSSCGEYINFNLPAHEEKIFVESYITEHDSDIVVVLQKTLDPFADIPGTVFDSLLSVEGAKVTITAENETVFLDNMGAKNWLYTFGKGTAYYKKSKIQEQRQYQLSVEYKGHKLYAATSFPSKTRITNPVVKYDYVGGNHIFAVKMNLTSEDNAVKHYRMNIMFDITLNDREYQIRSPYYYFNLSSREKAADFNQILRNSFISYSGAENQRPVRATIILERISGLYYNFKEAVEVQKDDNDTFLGSEVTEIPSNIMGGYGIFTGITRDTVCVNISK